MSALAGAGLAKTMAASTVSTNRLRWRISSPPLSSDLPGETWRQDGLESTALHFGHWLESIRTRQPFWEDAAAGHRAAACAHMINLSAREERVVKWDFQRNDIA